MCFTYIIYSKSLDKYYVGSTRSDLSERLRRHNSNHKGFSGRASDWVVVYREQYETYRESHSRELQIKSWKSRRMIEKMVWEVGS